MSERVDRGKPEVRAFFHKPTSSVSYVAADPGTLRAAIIDPVLDYDGASARTGTTSADEIRAYVAARGYTVEWILDTHIHADHLSAIGYLKDRIGAPTGIGFRVPEVQRHFRDVFGLGPEFPTDGSQFDHLFADHEEFRVGGLAAAAIHTPGHTPSCTSYYIGDAVFVGDTIFMPDYGTARCDFPGGDAGTLYNSIRDLLSLPSEVRVYVGHDYSPGGRPPAWESNIGQQRGWNIHVGEGSTEDQFVETRRARDAKLGAPALIIPALQVNMRGGRLPEPSADGRIYLRVPLNVF